MVRYSKSTLLRAVVALIAITSAVGPMSVLAANGGGQPGQALPANASQAVTQWLESNCEEGKLKAVTRFGKAVVPDLIAALVEGPPPSSLELVRKGANASYDRLVDQAQRKPDRRVASSRQVYVDRDVDNFDAQYRVRAAQALAVIGGTEARKALEAATRQTKRDDVQTTIKRDDVQTTIEELLKLKR